MKDVETAMTQPYSRSSLVGKLGYSQIASGIADIHDVNVIHRDVKPANMKIDNEEILKIIDFNLARDVKDGKTHGFVGTRGYAAPEQYSASVAVFGLEVDVYALGVVAWAVAPQGSWTVV